MGKGAEGTEAMSIRDAIKRIEKNIFVAEDLLGMNETPVEVKVVETPLALDYIQDELYRLNDQLGMIVAELGKVR